MLFIIEDGTSVANATTYASVQFFLEYFSTMGDADILDTDEEKIMSSLNRAAQYLDRAYRWKGTRTTRSQGLQFPRMGIASDNGSMWGSRELPVCLLTAQCELAKRAITSDLNPDPTTSPFGDNVKKYNIGASTFYENVEYAAPGEVSLQQKYPIVDSLIWSWLYFADSKSLNGVKIVHPFVSGAVLDKRNKGTEVDSGEIRESITAVQQIADRAQSTAVMAQKEVTVVSAKVNDVRVEVAATQVVATEAKTVANAVDGKVILAQAVAVEAKSEALAAKETAENVDVKAVAAQAVAGAAKIEASEAKSETAIVKSAIDVVDAKVVAAQTTAIAAQEEAVLAKTTADEAKADAVKAQADATEALARTPELATQTVPGIVKGSSTVTVDALGALHVASSGSTGGGIFVGQWLFLRQTRLPVGYVELNGTLYTDASTKFPDLVAYLEENQDEITTETDWQARSAAASGTGGVPFYVHDAVANTLRMPDTRGDSLYHGAVGTWQGDAIRNIAGAINSNWPSGGLFLAHVAPTSSFSGAYSISKGAAAAQGTLGNSFNFIDLFFDASKAVPTDSTNHPRRIGLTFAVYAGTIGA